VLRADAAGQISDIGQRVYRAPDGSFVTYTGDGVLTVWSASGAFIRNVGRQGMGPGEFARGPVSVHFDRKASVYVRDNNRRWTVMSAAFEYVRNANANGMEYSTERALFLDDGTFLSSGLSGNTGFFFNVYDFNAQSDAGPPIVRSFGVVPEAERTVTPTSRHRLIAYTGGTTFWAGPPQRAGRGYELELWSTDGRVLRTIRREVPWYPKGADRAPPRVAEGTPVKPPNEISVLAADTTGLLLVALYRTNEAWKPLTFRDGDAYYANRDASSEIRFEIIDTRAGAVLVSSPPMGRAQMGEAFMSGIIEGTSLGLRGGMTADDLPFIRIVEWRLVAQ
jgi:hypothetical protein